MMRIMLAMMLILSLSGCAAAVLGSMIAGVAVKTTLSPDVDYSPPEESGLVAVRPYPTPDDVCQVIGENALTANYLDDSALLIGCPTHESGAIADRKIEGAQELEIIGAWLLLSAPQ